MQGFKHPDGVETLHPLNHADWLIIATYLAGTLLLAMLSRRVERSSGNFLNASRTLPLWVAGLAFFSSNCGALELVGLAAVSAQYGVMALHYYWIGAVPALLVFALCILPMYMQARATSVPDFLFRRYGEAARRFNATSVLLLSVLLAGISLYAMASVLHPLLGWSFTRSAIVVAGFVLVYLLVGGLRASIFNEILQLGLIVVAIGPLSWMVLRQTHGIRGLLAGVPAGHAHLWSGLPLADRSVPADCVGVVFGLSFVLAFGYWTTDFRLIQRALSLENTRQAAYLPLIAAAGKLVFPLLVVVPGLAAGVLFARTTVASGGMGERTKYDLALSSMLERWYPHGMLGLGISALLAALMTALAGNVAAAAAVWTEDLYRGWLGRGRSEAHYLLVSRASLVAAAVAGVAAAFLALRFSNLMDYIQFVFSLFSAPLFAAVSLGMFTRWATASGGFWGLVVGTAAGCVHNALARFGLLHYGSQMTANFHGAVYAWAAAMGATAVVSACGRASGGAAARESPSPSPAAALEDNHGGGGSRSVETLVPAGRLTAPKLAWVLAGLIAIGCAVLNFALR